VIPVFIGVLIFGVTLALDRKVEMDNPALVNLSTM